MKTITGAVKPGDIFKYQSRKYTIVKIFPGNNSFVLHAEDEDHNPTIFKIYGEKVVINIEEIGAFVSNITVFVERLRHYGVSVPDEIDYQTFQNEVSKHLNVMVLTPFMGDSLEDKILTAPDEASCLKYLQMILDSLGNLLSQETNFLSVGIDLIPRNFVSQDGQPATYVDHVPPKIKVHDRYLLEIPEVTSPVAYDVGVYRHYDKMGIMHVLLTHVSKLRPEFYSQIVQTIEQYLSKIHQSEALDRFKRRFTATEINGTEADIQRIEKLGFSEIYDLREIASRYCYLGLLDRESLNEVFRLSHFQNEPIPEEDIFKIRSILVSSLGQRKKLEEQWDEAMCVALTKLGGTTKEGESLPYALERISRERCRDLKCDRIKLVIISGPTGVGKSYIASALESAGFTRIPNVFTRDIRPGERQGIDFIHMTREEFLQAEANGAFLQTNERHGYYHGLLKRLVEGALASNEHSYMDKSVPSTLGLHQLLGDHHSKYLTVYVLPPNPGELIRRITERAYRIGTAKHEDIVERLTTSLSEFPQAVGAYDLFLVHERDTHRVLDIIAQLIG